MIRRSQEPLTPKKLLDTVAFAELDWPGKTVRLERDSLQDYCQRLLSAQPSIAELYHENSALFPQMAGELAAAHVDADGVRREYLSRRAAVLAHSPQAELSAHWRGLLTGVAQAVPPELFYAIELRIAENGNLASHEPLSDQLYLVKRLSGDEWARLIAAIRLLEGSEEPVRPVFFVLGNFARNDLLFGGRGYRRTLMEAGRVIQAALEVASQLAVSTWPRLEFADRALNFILEADGVEEAALAAVELGAPDHVR
jgi:hypothetical protein